MIRSGGSQRGNIVAMLFGSVALVGLLGASVHNLVIGPATTVSKVTQQNMTQNDLLMNAKVVVMHASTLPQMGDEDGDGYVEPVAFVPTSAPSCNITLPGEGGCLPSDIGAVQTDPWGTQYAYCVWDHGDPRSSANRIDGEDSTSGAVLAIISAGPNKRFETPCLPYDGDPDTNDEAINPQGIGDDLVQIYTYAGAVAGSGGLWELKLNEPETAVIDKKLEVGDVAGGTGFAFDTQTGTGEFPYVKTDFLASKSGGGTPVEFMDNIALAGKWLSGDGDSEGIFVNSNGNVGIGPNASALDPTSKLMIGDRAITLHEGGASAIGFNAQYSATNNQWEKGSKPYWGAMVYHPEYGFFAFHSRNADGPASTSEALLTIRADGRVGIGTGQPISAIHAVGTGGENDDIRLDSHHDGPDARNAGSLLFYRSRGTVGTPTSVRAGDGLGWVRTHGYNGTQYYAAADIRFWAESDFDSERSAYITFSTIHDGSFAERMRLTSDGKVGFGTTTPLHQLHIMGSGGEEGTTSIFLQDPTTNSGYGGRFYFDDTNGQQSIKLSAVASGVDTGFIMLDRDTGRVGIGTVVPTHILHVNGVARSTQASFATSSDRRVKEDIEPLAEGLATIMRLRPVSFHYKPDYIEGKQGMDGLKRGFIAQEVEAVVPEMVTQAAEDIGDGETIDDFRILNNADFTPILVKAVQELKAENDDLRSELSAVRADNDNFRRELEELKAAVGQ